MPQRREDLHRFLHPHGVAIVGGIDRDLPESDTRARYDALYGAANWYLVSPRGGSVGSLAVYESVTAIPDPVELAVLSTPPEACPSVIDECGAKGVSFAIVFSSGFSEVGGEGVELERRLGEAGRRNQVRIFGPNTNTNAFEAQPAVPGYRYGKIGLVTQSGHNGRPIVQGSVLNIAFSRQVPCGNEVDLDVCDFIEYFAYDDDTAVVAGYIEGFQSPDKLRRALAACNDQGKPVVLLKIGSTTAGSAMAASHTGHLTGSDAVIDGLFRQYNVVRVRDLDELLETAALLAKLPRDCGPNVALYSVSGGSGTLMAEQAELAGIPAPRLSAQTQAALHEILPSYLTVSNPVDNGGTFVMRHPAAVRKKVLQLIMDDPAVDILLVGVTGAMGPLSDPLCEDIREMAEAGTTKPVITTWNSPKTDDAGYDMLVESQVPLFRSFRNCFTALARFNRWRDANATLRPREAPSARMPAGARTALADAGPGVLSSDATRALLEAFRIPMAREATVQSAAAAAAAAGEYATPVAMKVASPDFPHKSDAGLVLLGVHGPDAVKNAYVELVDRARRLDPMARIDGVLVQEMITDGTEMIIGITHDPVLGHALLVGLGGIFTEIFSDTAVRPLPVDEGDVRDMIQSLRGYPLLTGARGRARLDTRALTRAALAVTRLATALGPRLTELDLNPVIVRPRGVVAVDALVVLDEPAR